VAGTLHTTGGKSDWAGLLSSGALGCDQYEHGGSTSVAVAFLDLNRKNSILVIIGIQNTRNIMHLVPG
jgi:hypothetical protein